MSRTSTPVPEHFPLNTLGPALKELRAPTGAFDPAGPWQQAYGVYTLAGRTGRVGRLLLRRRAGQKGNVAIDVRYDKLSNAGRQEVTATMHTRDGLLSKPLRWTFEYRLLDPAGKPIPHTHLKKTAVVKDGQLEIKDAHGMRRAAVAGEYTLHWALFDAVQRLPREKTQPAHFTLIDHFDQVKPKQVLSFRKATNVRVGGEQLRLYAYDHVGAGCVPWVYWVDSAGRLLAAVSGLEAYLLA